MFVCFIPCLADRGKAYIGNTVNKNFVCNKKPYLVSKVRILRRRCNGIPSWSAMVCNDSIFRHMFVVLGASFELLLDKWLRVKSSSGKFTLFFGISN